MWWLLADGGAINANSVDRVIATGTDDAFNLLAWVGSDGYRLAGQWSTQIGADAALRRLTNALDAGTL